MIKTDDPRLLRLERAERAAWVWHPASARIVWANDAAGRLWGLKDGFLLVDRPFGPLDPSLADHELLSEGAARSEGIDGELRIFHGGGKRQQPVMARLFARTGDGDLYLFTSRPPQDDAPGEDAADPVRLLLGAFPLALALFGIDGRCRYANAAFTRLSGGLKAPPLGFLLGSDAAAERLIRALIGAGSLRLAPQITIRGRPMTLQIDAARVQDPRSRRSAFLLAAHDITQRRGREMRVRQELALVKAVLDHAVYGWIVLDAGLKVVSFGGPRLDAMGAKGARAIGRPFEEAFAALGLHAPLALRRALGSRAPLKRQAASLAEPQLEIEALPLKDEEGAFAGFHLIWRTRERAAPAQRAKPTERARAGLKTRTDAALIAHDNFEIVFANAAAAHLFGFRNEADLLKRPLLDLFPEDEARAAALYDRLRAGERRVPAGRIAARSVDGRTLVLEGEFRAARLEGRAVTLAVLSDVTAISQAEQALKARESEAADWFTKAPVALLLLDGKGAIARINEEAALLLETSDIAGRRFDELLEPLNRAAFEIRRAAVHVPGADRSPPAMEATLRIRADRPRPVAITLRAVASDGGKATLIGVHDLSATRLRQAELERSVEAATESNRQKTTFLSAISHEMRTPLNAILGFSEVMRDGRFGPVGNERYAGYIADIHMSGEHLLSLVNDLLDMAKIEAGRYELSFTPVDVGATLEQAVRILRPQADKKNIRLTHLRSGELPPVMADERSLKQIMINLLSNAIKFTPRDGTVTLSATFEPIGGLKISVSDTGIGMSEDDLVKALEPYRQVRRAANDEPGTGLGLPLAKALTEANHAHFRIESKREVGTTVEITFPAGQVVATGTAAEGTP